MTVTKDKYLDRLTSAHNDKPKFMASADAAIAPLVETQNLLSSLFRYFDLDPTWGAQGFDGSFSSGFGPDQSQDKGAIGVQLDILGDHINLARNIKVPLPTPWFALDDPVRCLDVAVWRQPYDPGSYYARLGDETYRLLLKARVAANRWDGTAAQAQQILLSFFENGVSRFWVEDRQVMQIVFAVSGKIPPVEDLEILSGGYLPLSTAGVKAYHLVTTIDETPLFGLDVDGEFIAGLDEGSWGADPRFLIENQLAT